MRVQHMSTAEKGARPLGPLDAVRRDPDHHGVLLENQHVRVLDAILRRGEQTEIHDHVWPSALYVLSWSDFLRVDPEGKVLVDSRTMGLRPRPGEAIWSPTLPPHRVRNVGNTDLRLIAVELKSLH
jgi:mannose-6-phosphate isomerase-like protein (cupin superfamily)